MAPSRITDLTELDAILSERRRLLRVVALTVAGASVATALVLVLGLAPAAAASTSGAPGISIVAWQPERNGTTVWRGSPARLGAVRFLRGARVPTLSAGGSGVAYVRHAGGGLDVYLTGTYRGTEMKLAHVAGTRTTSVAIAPDLRRVAFVTANGVDVVLNAAGNPRRTIPLPVRWRGSRYAALAFSPDGQRLAFSRTWGEAREGTLRNELAVVGLDGSGPRSLARNPDPFGSRYEPTFTPDGTRIAFAAADGSLATVPVAGGPPTRLTQPRTAGSERTADVGPVYSADGRWVAFTRLRPSGPSEVYVVRADGTGLRQLTITPVADDPGQPRTGSIALAWSPGGTSVLAFRRDEFAAVGLISGESSMLARVGPQYGITGAAWH